MNNIQNMQQKHINNKLWNDNNHTEEEIVNQITLPNLIILWNLCFICEQYDKQQSYWYQEQSQSLACIRVNRAKQCFQTFSLFSIPFKLFFLACLLVYSGLWFFRFII